MITCLTDYIGLRNVSDDSEAPTSGIYVNDLPGISSQHFSDIVNDELDGISAEWDKIEERSIRAFETDLRSRLKKYFTGYQLISSGITGYVDDNTQANHGSGVYSGWLFDMYTFSPSLKVEINDVRVNLVSAQNFNVKIFDANTGLELYTKAVVGVQGAQTIKINQSFAVYQHNKIFVCYDTVSPYRVYQNPTFGAISAGSISTSSTVLSDNLSSAETGLEVTYNIKCSIEEFVCHRLENFQEAYLYRIGLEFLKNSKYSDKINRWTLLDIETTNQLIEEFKMEYENLLESSLMDLKVPDDGICFICNKAISEKVLIP